MEISVNNTHEAVGLSKVCDFTIETNGIMVKALTSRLYAHPISSIVRELASNALDACPDVPMEINIPTYLTPYFSVRDYGPGISPDDMATIFTHFGSSTKRKTNTQIGGFGLGAKSPFAIVNSFTIYSHYEGTCYHYVASIQQDGMPALHVVSTRPTNSSGVEIQVPASDRFSAWISALDQIRHFNPRPIIQNLSYSYPEVLHDSAEFAVMRGGPSAIMVGPVAYPFRDSVAITDGIPIPSISLKFGIGELEVTASREEIVYTSEVIAKIRSKFMSAIKEYELIVQSLLDKASTLGEAFAIMRGVISNRRFVWRNGEIHPSCYEFPATLPMGTVRILSGRQLKRRNWDLARPWGRFHRIYDNSTVFLADADKLQRRIQLHPAFPAAREIYVVDCDPSVLDGLGIAYHRLSSVTLPKSVRNSIPVRLRAMSDNNRFVTTTSVYSHYLQLDSNKSATINGITRAFDYTQYRLFEKMLGHGFYVLPHNIKKIPSHLLPIEPVILASVASETARFENILKLKKFYDTVPGRYHVVGKLLSCMGLISPLPPPQTETSSAAHHLLSYGLADKFFQTLPDYNKEITDVMKKKPRYRNLQSLSIADSEIPVLADLIKKD